MAEIQFTITELEQEIWKPIPGFEGWYSVSNLGRIRRDHSRPGTYIGRILKWHPNHDGYAQVGLSKDAVQSTHPIHKLVARAFLGVPPKGQEVNHKDGDKWNPRLSNLEYGTHLYNMRHSRDVINTFTPSRARGDYNGSRKHPERLIRGEAHHKAKITEADVREIRRLGREVGLHGKALSSQYPIGACMVNKIQQGLYWAHIPD